MNFSETIFKPKKKKKKEVIIGAPTTPPILPMRTMSHFISLCLSFSIWKMGKWRKHIGPQLIRFALKI